MMGEIWHCPIHIIETRIDSDPMGRLGRKDYILLFVSDQLELKKKDNTTGPMKQTNDLLLLWHAIYCYTLIQ